MIDKLYVFVSSTIKECADERIVTRRAIESINLDPILFEHVGSRPHPPRHVYKERLEKAHIFVGIYREKYGWIAPDMSISGIDDELKLSTAMGMDRLIYVLEDAPAREPRLQELIRTAEESGVTL